MNSETIEVRVTQTGQTMEVVIYNKRAEVIEVVLGTGIHSVKCALTPTRNGLAYAGTVMGREIVYERSREQVQADIDRLNPTLRKSPGSFSRDLGSRPAPTPFRPSLLHCGRRIRAIEANFWASWCDAK